MNFCFSISTYVEFIDSSRSESYHCWKGSIIALPVHSKSSGSFQLWSGQSHSLSKKSGKEKEATQWVAQPAGRPTMQHNCQVHSVFSLRGRINLSFFFPHVSTYFHIWTRYFWIHCPVCHTFMKSVTGLHSYWQRWAERWRHGQKVWLDRSCQIKSKSIFSIHLAAVGTNMKRLCPTYKMYVPYKMYSFKRELILQIAFFWC